MQAPIRLTNFSKANAMKFSMSFWAFFSMSFWRFFWAFGLFRGAVKVVLRDVFRISGQKGPRDPIWAFWGVSKKSGVPINRQNVSRTSCHVRLLLLQGTVARHFPYPTPASLIFGRLGSTRRAPPRTPRTRKPPNGPPENLLGTRLGP